MKLRNGRATVSCCQQVRTPNRNCHANLASSSREFMSTFSQEEKAAFYKAVTARRDVRSGFLDRDIDDSILRKVLMAAHEAPSVGFMQPWNFIIIRDVETRQQVAENFRESREKEAQNFSGERRELYDSLKLEGILEAPLSICVTCDHSRDGETGLGRSQQPEMDLYSTVCAVQNLWLAARVEGIGIGWVSILNRDSVKELLGIPDHIEIVAWLCAGYVEEF